MDILARVLILFSAFGILQAAASLVAVHRFAGRPRHRPTTTPKVTILKPVCGAEPLLEEALASFCQQDYPAYQLVIGAQDPADPALIVAHRVRARFPRCDISIVVDRTRHGTNGKIANLMNMLPVARHDVLVIADSDLHVQPDYLRQVVAELAQPGTGLVTTVPAGEPASPGLAARVGASHLTHAFLPSALLAASLGRQDCLGGTMALRRHTLERAGGLAALVDHLADDNVLGRLVRAQGLAVRLANTLPVVTVQEASLGALWLHELRWARTIGALAPMAYSACVLQYPLFWALMLVAACGGAPWSVMFLLSVWLARALIVGRIDAALASRRARPARSTPFWLLPLRDVLSVAEIAFSFCGSAVVWRGRVLHADRGDLVAPAIGVAETPGLANASALTADESLAA
jgi:ceramide glucosyltransferase